MKNHIYIYIGDDYTHAADFLAYSEIAQVGPYFGNFVPVNVNVSTWIESMKKVPYHDEVRVALKHIVGDIDRAHNVGIPKKGVTEKNMIWLKAIKNIVNEKQKSKLYMILHYLNLNDNPIFKMRQSNVQ